MINRLYICLLLLLIGQNLCASTLLYEPFNLTTLPAGWNNSAIQGTALWTFRNAPVFSSPSAGNYAVFDDQALGAGVTPNQAALRTPSVNCVGHTAVYLRYSHHWFGVEFTHGYVEVSNDGGTSWTTLVDYHMLTRGSLAAPQDTILNITAFAANQANVMVRFRYTDGSQAGRYWYIDDVRIYSDPDVGVTDLIAPPYLTCATSYTAAQAVRVRIFNYGPDVINAVALPVTVQVTGAVNVTLNDTYTGPIPAQGSVDFTLSSTLNMASGGTYNFTAYTGLATDAYLANNSFTTTRTNRINSYPYVMNFNGTDGGWVANPNSGTRLWQWGSLPPAYGVDGPEGNGDSWRLTATGGSGNPFVESPIFDFTGLSNPVLSFDFKMVMNSSGCWNGVRVEYSLNGGAWTALGTNSDPLWYSTAPYCSGYTGWGGNGGTVSVGNWNRVERALCMLANQSCVKFRINTDWINTGLLPIEFAFDNFTITNNSPDVGATAIIAPASGSGAGCGYSAATPVTVRVYNLRCSPVTNVPVTVNVTGPNPQTLSEVISAAIPAYSFVDYTFTGMLNLSAVGTYGITAATSLAGDMTAANNSTNTNLTVTVPTVNSYPYIENFNPNNGFWEPQVSSASWQWTWGALPPTYGVDGPEGQGNSWRLNAVTGSGNLALVSPIFDLSAINDPELSFDFKMVMNSSGCWNGVRVEYTLNNGVSWTVLGNNGTPNWYSLAPYCSGYTGWGGNGGTVSVGNWTRATYKLCEVGGNTCVRFRIVTDWLNAGIGPREFAVDNFFIGNPEPYDISVVNIQQPVTGNCSGFTNAEPVTVVIENNACIPLYNVPVSVNMSGTGTAVLNGVIPVLPRKSRTTFTFSGTLNMFTDGDYTLTAAVTHADMNPANNTLVHTRTSNVINTFPYTENFNADNGDFAPSPVNANRMWTWGQIDPTYTVDGPEGNGNSWYLYVNGGSGNPYVETPHFNLTGLVNPVLKFDFKMVMNSSGCWNGVRVEYSTNGGSSWTALGSNSDPFWYGLAPYCSGYTGWGGNGGITTVGNWTRVERNLCQLTGQNCVKFRFSTDWINSGIMPVQFAFDNFQILDEAPDVAVSAILSPQNNAAAGCSYNATTTTTIRVWNLRCAAVNNVPVRVDANGPVNSSVTGTVPSIPGNSFVDYTFSGGLNLTAVGSYTIRAYTQLAGDVRINNDSSTINLTVSVPTIASFPYTENFNANNGFWVPDVSSASWQWTWGALPPTYGVDGPEGQGNSWRLDAVSGSGNLALVSPIFDLSAINDPELSFDFKMVMNSSGCWNGVRVEYTLNNGANWTVLGNNSSTGWYSVAPYCSGYTGWGGNGGTVSVGNWTRVSYRLCEVGGNSCVRFRIVTDWLNSGISPREFAMDNFSITAPQPYDLKVVNVMSPGTGNCGGFTAAEPVTVVVESDACIAITNVPVTVQITGAVTATLTGVIPNIPRKGRATFTLPGTVNMTAAGNYNFNVSITHADANVGNNTLIHTRSSIRINTFPYTENFNADNGDFGPGPVNQDRMWTWGPLAPTYAGDGPDGQGSSWYLYVNGGTGNPYVESPFFDLSTISNPQLSMDIKMHINSSGCWNGVRVEYSTNGGTSWTTLGTNSDPGWYSSAVYCSGYNGWGGNGGTRLVSDWLRVQRSLCTLAGQSCVKFRISTDWINSGIQPVQFAFDNFTIASSPADAGVSAVLLPATGGSSACTYRDAVTSRVRVYNFSCSAINNLPVSMQVTGPIPAVLNEIVPTIAANSFIDYTFTGTLNLSVPGTYQIRSYTGMVGDINNSNDTATHTLTVQFSTINSYPYIETFNSSNGGWLGQSNSANWEWEWGTVAAGYAVDGPEGRGNTWYLDAGSGSGNLSLFSPIFDMTSVVNPELVFDFKMRMNSSGCWNGVRVEYSTNGGSSWTTLGTNADAEWYGIAPYCSGYTGWGGNGGTVSVGNWTTVRFPLCIVKGQSCVQFRLQTDWLNAGIGPREFTIDNFRILDTPLDAAVTSVTGCYGSAYGMNVNIHNRQRCLPGTNITSANLTYSINGTLTTLNLTGLNIAPGASYTYTVSGVTIPDQSAVVRAWINNPNGSPDGIAYNDTTTANPAAWPNCNDHCSNATVLGLGTTTASQTSNATPDPSEDPNYAPCGSLTIENTVWYQFTTNSSGDSVTVYFENQECAPSQNGIQISIDLATTACDPSTYTNQFCTARGDTTAVTWGPYVLPPNTTYYISIDGFAGSDCEFDIRILGAVDPVILPVDLLGFNTVCVLNGRAADIHWQTAQEENLNYFSVERSYDGLVFETLSEIQALGGNQVNAYTFRDVEIDAGKTVYYRLKQTDLNKNETFSPLRALNCGKEQTGLNVYPNPSAGNFMVEAALKIGEDWQLDIYNALGQKIFTESAAATTTQLRKAISLEDLPAGAYWLQLQLGTESYSEKIIITRD